MIPVRVAGIALDPAGQHVILLKPIDEAPGEGRILPIWIGAQEATSILAADMRSAQREAYRAITSRHRGATKIDLRIVVDPLSSGPDHSPEVPGRLAMTSVQNDR